MHVGGNDKIGMRREKIYTDRIFEPQILPKIENLTSPAIADADYLIVGPKVSTSDFPAYKVGPRVNTVGTHVQLVLICVGIDLGYALDRL